MMKILVVDDELLARKKIIKLLQATDYTEDIFEASSGKEAIGQINTTVPDLVFLDIQMTDMTGFEVLKCIRKGNPPLIIFVTAFDHFAVKAFEVQAIDFLLKPFRNDRFFSAFQRAIEQIKNQQKARFQTKINALINFLDQETLEHIQPAINYLTSIAIKLRNKYYFVQVNQIKYITSSAYYAEIFTLTNEKHVYRISMTDFIKKLNPKNFIRINRSTIIHLNQIKEVVSEGCGEFSLMMNDGKQFSLSKLYKAEFFKKVNIKS